VPGTIVALPTQAVHAFDRARGYITRFAAPFFARDGGALKRTRVYDSRGDAARSDGLDQISPRARRRRISSWICSMVSPLSHRSLSRV
jgi:hypothetical protein